MPKAKKVSKKSASKAKKESVVQEAAPAAPEVSEDSGKRFNILATTPMIGEYVKQVAGQNVDVEVLMPYAVDPHTYEPSPKDVAKISDADLVFHVGIKYENSALLKLLENTVQTEQALIALGSKVNPIEFKTDDHDDHAGHDHGVFDPHFWFDPTRVALAVGEIKEELIKLDPENKNSYELSANSYVEKLKDLDKQIEALIQTIPDENRHLVTTHESLGYLESRYGLEVLVTVIPNITTEDGVTPKQLVELSEEIKEHENKVIFFRSSINWAEIFFVDRKILNLNLSIPEYFFNLFLTLNFFLFFVESFIISFFLLSLEYIVPFL